MPAVSPEGDRRLVEDAEKLIAKQRQMTETVNKVIIEGLSKGMTAKEILDAAYEKLKEAETGSK